MVCRTRRVSCGGYTFIGYSLAGEESVVGVKELNVCFDIGRAPTEILNLDNVLLTHGHMDHAAGIAYYFSQRNFLGNPGGTLVVPTEMVGSIHKLMAVWAEIEGHRTPYRVIGLGPGEEYTIRKGLIARSFDVVHPKPSLGYSVIEIREKLKEEYIGRSGRELARLRRSGVKITYELEVPLVCYCGDTAYGDFLKLDWVRKAKVLILECTFISEEHRMRADAGYHMHLDDFVRLQDELENEHILLIHLSRRTPIRVALQELRRRLSPEKLDRISFLMASRGPVKRTLNNRGQDVGGDINR